MAFGFVKKTWKDRISEYPTRRTLTKEDGSTELVTVSRSEGTVSQEGDAFSADNLNDLETRVDNALTEANSNLTIRYNQETDMVQVLGESGEWYDWKSIGLKGVSLYDSGVKGKFGMNSAIWKCAQSSGTTSVVFNANSITMRRYWNTGIAADGCMIFTTSPFNLADYNTIILDATLATACVMEFYFTTVYPEFNNNYMPTGATLLKNGVTASGEYNFDNSNVPEGANVYFIATITSTSSSYTDVSAIIKSIKLKRT